MADRSHPDRRESRNPDAAGSGTNTAGDTPSPGEALPGILRKVTAADCGIVDTPALAPHLEFRLIGVGQALLVSESFNTLLRGRIHGDLLPLLDGNRTQGELVAALAGSYSAQEVRRALVSLADRGYVVSGEHAMRRGPAASLSSLGCSPRWAEERLRASRVAVTGDDGHLAGQLRTLGVGVDAERPTLSVIVCQDYLDNRHDAVNRRCIAAGASWMLVRPKGMQPLFGPVFRPAERGPCWSCLAYRQRGHQEVHNFLRNLAGDDAAFAPFAAEPAVLDAVYGIVAAEIAKWLVLGDMASIHERAISLDLGRLAAGHHPVMRRPQCFACGDESLHRPDRTPVPVRLRPSPNGVRNSGGLRSVTPEETLSRYRHLVSPVSGVVTWLKRTTDEADAWLHVHWAGSNVALRGRKLSSLRRSLRSKSAGKGSTPRQSEASALCEAIERYSGAYHGDEIRRRRRFADFVRAGKEEAIHPNDVQLFSAWQLENAEQVNARGHPYNVVPAPLDPGAEIDWSPVWSLTQGRHRYLPTSMLYGMTAEQRGRCEFAADSNGCAAGNTLEEAILQGFLELVERDAFALWWYNRLRVPGVDLDSFDDDYLAATFDQYRRFHREAWVLEFDIEPMQDGTCPEPGIFLYPEEWLLVGDGRRARDLGVVVDAIASAAGWQPDAAERRQAERVYSAMRPETTVRSVGVFPSRARGLRLAITGFTGTRDVTAFLERADWPGSPSVVDSTLSPLEERGAFAYMGVHFDLQAHGVGPRLGISLFARKAEWLKDVRHWTALIDGMREQRLAVPEKLSAFAGSSSGAEALFGKSGPFLLLRGIHHIKLSLVEDRVEQTKAYVFLLMMGSAPRD